MENPQHHESDSTGTLPVPEDPQVTLVGAPAVSGRPEWSTYLGAGRSHRSARALTATA